MKSLFIILILLFSSNCWGQIWSHTFETTGGYTTSASECTDNSYDYFTRTNGSNISSDPVGQEGSYYFAAEDIDACGTSTATKTLLFNDLSIAGCSGLSLEVWAASIGNTNTNDNWDGGDYVHIEYQIDNSGTWLNAIWFESSGSNDEPAAHDPGFDGVGNTNLTNTFQNFSGTITGSGSVIDIRVVFNLNDDYEDIKLDNFRLFGTGCGATSNTITTGAVSTAPFTVTCNTGTSGSVTFTSSGTFNPGNIFTVQLSDASGSFTNPISIGSLDSTSSVGPSPSGTINFSIPAETASGAGYQIRIISTNPGISGTESAAFAINLSGGPCTSTPAYLTSVIINSCNPTCLEGRNELIFGNTGNYSITMNSTNLGISYGSTYPLGRLTDALTSNSATTASINTAAGCAGTFLDGTGLTLPPNSSFILANNQLCVDALQWSGLCGAGPIYIIYTTDATWNLNGTFKNGNTGGIRYFNSNITTTSGQTFSIDYNYNSTLLQTGTAGDGDYVSFGSNGGAATYGDNDCILTPVLLPSSLLNFSADYINKETILNWQTGSEQNNAHFTISHSKDGYYFEQIGIISGAGNSSELQEYRFTHNLPNSGMNYYKLHSTDYDGTTYFKGIVAIEASFNFSFFNSHTSSIELSNESDIDLYSLDGKLIRSLNGVSSIPFDQSGMYILLDKRSGVTERLFIP